MGRLTWPCLPHAATEPGMPVKSSRGHDNAMWRRETLADDERDRGPRALEPVSPRPRGGTGGRPFLPPPPTPGDPQCGRAP